MEKYRQSSFALFLLADICLFLFLGQNGPQVQVDTANYYSAAYNLLNGNGFLLFDGEHLQNAPPFVSILAMPCYIFGIPERTYIYGIQLIAFNGTLLFIHKLLSHFKVSNQFLANLFVITFGFSWLHIWSLALSEAVFLPLFLAWIYFLIKPGKYNLTFVAVLFVLLSLTRYMSWMLIPGLIIPILFIKFFWRKALISILPGMLTSLIWWFYNLHYNGRPFGEHELTHKFSIVAAYENFAIWSNQLCNGAFSLNLAFLIYLLSLVVLTIIFLILKNKLDEIKKALFGVVIGMGLSLTFLLMIQPELSFLQLPRYISVLWTPFAILLYLCIDSVKLNENFRIVMLIASISLHLIVFQIQGVKQREKANLENLSNLAFSTYLQSSACKLGNNNLSNFPDLVWWTSKKQCKYTPFLDENRNSFLARLGSNQTQNLIWFESKARSQVMRSDLDWVSNKKPCFQEQGFSIIALDSLSY